MSPLRVLATCVAFPFIAATAHAQVISLITTPAGTFSGLTKGSWARMRTCQPASRSTTPRAMRPRPTRPIVRFIIMRAQASSGQIGRAHV